MARSRRSSVGRIPAKTNRLSVGVERRHPVTMRSASLIGLLMRRVWVLRHQTGAQYSAAECTRARVAVRNVVAPAPQVDPASRLRSPTRVVSFLRSDSKCRRNVSALSNFMPRYVGSAQYGRSRPSTLMESSRRASLLFRWKAADTVLVVLGFSFHVWRYEDKAAKSWFRVPSSVCQLLAECKIAKSSAYANFLAIVTGRS